MEMRVRSRSKIVYDAITFDELVEHGRKSGASLTRGMPWSFTYKGASVTHETDTCYIVAGVKFHQGDVLVSDLGDVDMTPAVFSRSDFEASYEPCL